MTFEKMNQFNIWDNILEGLKECLGATTVHTWFSNVKIKKAKYNSVVLSTSTAFKAAIIETRFLTILKTLFSKAMGFPVQVEIAIRD